MEPDRVHLFEAPLWYRRWAHIELRLGKDSPSLSTRTEVLLEVKHPTSRPSPSVLLNLLCRQRVWSVTLPFKVKIHQQGSLSSNSVQIDISIDSFINHSPISNRSGSCEDCPSLPSTHNYFHSANASAIALFIPLLPSQMSQPYKRFTSSSEVPSSEPKIPITSLTLAATVAWKSLTRPLRKPESSRDWELTW